MEKLKQLNTPHNRVIVAVLAIAIIGFIVLSMRGPKESEDISQNTLPTYTETTNTDGMVGGEGAGRNADVIARSTSKPTDLGAGTTVPLGIDTDLNYGDAIKKYAGYRFQFNDKCQASPSAQTFKIGTNIMLDNRANKTQTLKVGSTYTLPAYSWKIISLDTLGTFLVDCGSDGSSQNVATIMIQK
jgi:hypothetical protein